MASSSSPLSYYVMTAITRDTLMTSNDSLNVTKSDGDEDRPYTDFYKASQFVTGAIFYPIICIVGLTCNSLALVVLSHKKMMTTTNVFLSALAVADVIKLANDFLYFVDLVLVIHDPPTGEWLYGVLYPVSHYIFNQSTCVAAWLTVSVAVERYLSVCRPMSGFTGGGGGGGGASLFCSVRRARTISVLVFVTMSAAAVPSGLRYVRVSVTDERNVTSYDVRLSALGQNESFMVPYAWTQNLLRSIVPLCALLALNSCIIHALGRRQRVAAAAGRKKTKTWKAKNRITVMLIVVVIVFIVCIIPDAVLSTCFGFGYADEKNMLAKGVREITDMLLALSSAVNFIIYCLCNKLFRDIFLEIFCRRRLLSLRRDQRFSTAESRPIESAV